VILPRLGWIATASGGGSPSNAIDSNSTTRWDTGAYQVPGQRSGELPSVCFQ
jgi:hypothetical protein